MVLLVVVAVFCDTQVVVMMIIVFVKVIHDFAMINCIRETNLRMCKFGIINLINLPYRTGFCTGITQNPGQNDFVRRTKNVRARITYG